VPSAALPFITCRTQILYRGAFERFVNAVEGDDAVLELEVAAWTEGRECRFDDAEVRLEADCQRAPMDVVKLMGDIPGVF
jgi:hypothetical protein